MIKRTISVTLDGKSKADYEAIVAKLESENPQSQGWVLIKEPLVNRVTATKTEEVSL